MTVGIVMGSNSDLAIMSEAANALEQFRVACEMVVTSAHRHSEKVARYARGAVEAGLKVILRDLGWRDYLAEQEQNR